MTLSSSRRQFLQRSGLLLSFTVGARTLLLSPEQAYAEKLALQVLSATESATLESIAEALVPGARSAGVAHFVDNQLAASQEDCLLMLKYLGVPAEGFRSFYQSALAAADTLARQTHGAGWDKLSSEQTGQLLTAISGPDPDGWQGPPAGFFTFVLRADACDVVYGTDQGFASVGMPYMAHIKPESSW
jgi:hypothetical protein